MLRTSLLDGLLRRRLLQATQWKFSALQFASVCGDSLPRAALRLRLPLLRTRRWRAVLRQRTLSTMLLGSKRAQLLF